MKMIKASRYVGFIAVLLLFIHPLLRADEGMWMINRVKKNIETMRAMGLKLTAEDIYSVDGPSLKDAVVLFDGVGCTGELVSAKGLFFTNHHCGLESVQALSTPENNLLERGYWATSQSEELPIEGKSALILVDIEDVTATVMDQLNPSLPNKEYMAKLEEVTGRLALESELKTGLHTVIRPFYNNNRFYKFSYQRYNDIRLVGVPPTAIGNFGGDVDNWHWPRHTGDFCVFRIYTSPDGKPASYSPENVPYKPKYFFPISLKGVKEDDFTMVIGYPGKTHRFATSFEAIYNRDVVAQFKREVWGNFINVIRKARSVDSSLWVTYTDKHDYLVNFYQKDVWQADAMNRYRVVERLVAREDSFRRWAGRNPALRSRYLSVFPVIEEYFNKARENRWEYIQGSLSALSFFPVEIDRNINACSGLLSAVFEQQKPYSPFMFWKKDRIRQEARKLKKRLPELFESYNYYLDMNLYTLAFGGLFRSLGPCPGLGLLSAMQKIENIQKTYPLYIEGFYNASYFTKSDNLSRLLKHPHIDSLKKDPLFLLSLNYNVLWDSIYNAMADAEANYNRAMQLYTRGLMEMDYPGLSYPDANSTMRYSYGTVRGYSPNDGTSYKYYTTLNGVMEKEDPFSDIFTVPDKLKQLWKSKDYGPYAGNGELRVCFLTNNDITGGNSGSPVVNGNGELVGIAFDGNAEAMASDFIYEPDIQRTIAVDIRYVLFIIDKYADSRYIMNELVINR